MSTAMIKWIGDDDVRSVVRFEGDERPRWYILDDYNNPIPITGCNAVFIHSNWQKNNPDRRRVAASQAGGALISTVFLGLDHNYGPSGPPILFETMIFGGFLDQYQERYLTWELAEIGHAVAVGKARRARYNPSNYLKWVYYKTVPESIRWKVRQLWRNGFQFLSDFRRRI